MNRCTVGHWQPGRFRNRCSAKTRGSTQAVLTTTLPRGVAEPRRWILGLQHVRFTSRVPGPTTPGRMVGRQSALSLPSLHPDSSPAGLPRNARRHRVSFRHGGAFTRTASACARGRRARRISGSAAAWPRFSSTSAQKLIDELRWPSPCLSGLRGTTTCRRVTWPHSATECVEHVGTPNAIHVVIRKK